MFFCNSLIIFLSNDMQFIHDLIECERQISFVTNVRFYFRNFFKITNPQPDNNNRITKMANKTFIVATLGYYSD